MRERPPWSVSSTGSPPSTCVRRRRRASPDSAGVAGGAEPLLPTTTSRMPPLSRAEIVGEAVIVTDERGIPLRLNGPARDAFARAGLPETCAVT